MCHNCLNTKSHLLLNPDNENGCKCGCKLMWLDVVHDAFDYGFGRQNKTHIICSQCGHYGIIAGTTNEIKEAIENE